MTGCEKYIEMISELIDGELSPEQESQLRSHIEDCQECKRVYEAFCGVSNALSDDLVEPPEMLAKGTMFKIRAREKHNSKFVFGRFTALAACFALIIFGATHFGLFDGTSHDSNDDTVLFVEDSSNASEGMQGLEIGTDNDASSNSLANNKSDFAPEYQSTSEGEVTTGHKESTVSTDADPDPSPVYQLGFPMRKFNGALNNGTEKLDEREPVALAESEKLFIYTGEYYTEDELKNADSETENDLLLTVEDTEQLNIFKDIFAAAREPMIESASSIMENLTDEPVFSLLIPADKEKDPDANDICIRVWVIDKELWCVIQDVPEDSGNESASENEITIYKATGSVEQLASAITRFKNP